MQQAAGHGFHRVTDLACGPFAFFRQADQLGAFVFTVGGTEHQVAAFKYIKQAGYGWGFDFKGTYKIGLAHGRRQQAQIQDRPPCGFGQPIVAQVMVDLPAPCGSKPGEATTK
mgnify:CR=1 FL=1